MRLNFTTLAAIAALLIAAMLAVTVPAAAQAVTPLDQEPPSLRDVPDQHIFDHTVTPTSCTAVVDRDLNVVGCAEVIEHWICPAGTDGSNPLSVDARNRVGSYSDLINPDRAYRNGHCLIVRTEPFPVPVDTVACPEGGTAIRINGALVCAVTATPTPTPTAAPTTDVPQQPPLAFTGAETSVLGYLGAGLIAFGAVALGARRRWFDNTLD